MSALTALVCTNGDHWHTYGVHYKCALIKYSFGGNRLEGILENQTPTPSMGGMGCGEALFSGRVGTLHIPVNYIMLRGKLLNVND